MTDMLTARQRVIAILLGQDAKQQRYVLRSLLAIVAYLSGCLIGEVGLAYGLIDRSMVRWYEGIALAGGTVTYIVVRLGWAHQRKDPALTLFQMVFASTLAIFAYAVFDQIRGALIAIQMAVVVFGTFNLRRRVLWFFSVYVMALMAVTMITMHHWYPKRFPAELEIVHFIVLLTLQPSVVVLSGQFGAMRRQLKKQRADLELAVQQIQELASRDVLTGLYNRRHAMALLDHQVKSHVRSPRPCALVMVDLDHFKRINDQYGHHIGDEALKVFAEQAQEVLRESELIARWGGEEFLLVLPEAQVEGALVALGRLRAALLNKPVSSTCPDVRVTFSAGLTDLKEAESSAHAIQRADQALYEAKARGRGCDVVRHEIMST